MCRQGFDGAVSIALGFCELVPHGHQLSAVLDLHPVEAVDVEVESFESLIAVVLGSSRTFVHRFQLVSIVG